MKTLSSEARSTVIGRRGAWLLSNRSLMRAPIALYRARLGFLLGSRTLMLEHIGRKSGARRHVVLEVVGRPAPDIYVVASGFGERAQWYRNLMAQPHARVSIAGHRPRAATARRLPAAEADAVLAGYISRHPRAWAKFRNVLEHTLGTEITEHGTPLPLIELRLSARS
jgi:deazaflavin-dependent oxidoreductase (nitroreductase family)